MLGYDDIFSSFLAETNTTQNLPIYTPIIPVQPIASPLPQESTAGGSKRANQNLACRNYRKKKKEYTQGLEARIAELETENKTLKLQCLQPGVTNISSEDTAVVQQMKQLFDQLEDALQRDDVQALEHLLSLFAFTIERYSTVYEKEIEKLVNPVTQTNLARMGYIADPTEQNSIYQPENPFWEQLLGEVTPEQRQKLEVLNQKFANHIVELRAERVALDKYIKQFCTEKLRIMPSFAMSYTSTPTPVLENTEILEFSRHLNMLKKNFFTNRNMVIDMHTQLGQILGVKHLAGILIKIKKARNFDVYAQVQRLSDTWQILSSGALNNPGFEETFFASLKNK